MNKYGVTKADEIFLDRNVSEKAKWYINQTDPLSIWKRNDYEQEYYYVVFGDHPSEGDIDSMHAIEGIERLNEWLEDEAEALCADEIDNLIFDDYYDEDDRLVRLNNGKWRLTCGDESTIFTSAYDALKEWYQHSSLRETQYKDGKRSPLALF